AGGTDELLGRGRRLPQSIASEGPIGRPVETGLVLPRGRREQRPRTRIAPACRAPSPGSDLFNPHPGTSGASPLPPRLLTTKSINGFGGRLRGKGLEPDLIKTEELLHHAEQRDLAPPAGPVQAPVELLWSWRANLLPERPRSPAAAP